MHEHYVRAINWALEAGRDSDAYELADAYAKDLGATETRVSEPVA